MVEETIFVFCIPVFFTIVLFLKEMSIYNYFVTLTLQGPGGRTASSHDLRQGQPHLRRGAQPTSHAFLVSLHLVTEAGRGINSQASGPDSGHLCWAWEVLHSSPPSWPKLCQDFCLIIPLLHPASFPLLSQVLIPNKLLAFQLSICLQKPQPVIDTVYFK